jgi:hypothetical protein
MLATASTIASTLPHVQRVQRDLIYSVGQQNSEPPTEFGLQPPAAQLTPVNEELTSTHTLQNSPIQNITQNAYPEIPHGLPAATQMEAEGHFPATGHEYPQYLTGAGWLAKMGQCEERQAEGWDRLFDGLDYGAS